MLKSCRRAADIVQGGGVVVPVRVIAGVGVVRVGVGGICCSSIIFTITATWAVATGVLPCWKSFTSTMVGPSLVGIHGCSTSPNVPGLVSGVSIRMSSPFM